MSPGSYVQACDTITYAANSAIHITEKIFNSQESGSKCVQMLLKKHKDLIESTVLTIVMKIKLL